MKYENNFGAQSGQYARYRPRYPGELYVYLASLTAEHTLVWDCGTGSGQAAVGLVEHFERVYATDASEEQIAHAQMHPSVEYHVENAGRTSLATASADLVTVAQAVHWFDLDAFYTEVKRVLKPGGVLAVWTYNFPEITPSIDRIIADYYFNVLSGFWPEGVHYVEQKYTTLPFPFEEITPPSFAMEIEWGFDHMMGFLDSWSGTQRYLARKGLNPLNEINEALASEWGNETKKRLIRWPMYFRIGRKV